MDKKLETTYLTNCNLLIEQDLRQAHYRILLIVSLKEIIKINANMDIIIKNGKRVELNIKTMSAAYNTKTLKMI